MANSSIGLISTSTVRVGWSYLFTRGGSRIEKVFPTGVPLGLALPKWENTLVVRALERMAYDSVRVSRTLFAYQFVIVARPEVKL
ncbi:MAG: hypothetical protein ABSH28_23800 [Acidobacteriota bacterium]